MTLHDRLKRFDHFYLYGATPAAKGTLDMLKRMDKAVIGFVDRDTEKQSKPFHDLPVISPDDLLNANEDIGIIIVSAYQLAIHQYLRGAGVDRARIFPLLDPMFFPTYGDHFLRDARLDALEDQLTGQDQRYFSSWRQFKASGDLGILDAFTIDYPQYHRPEFLATIPPGGVGLDIGAYDGQSALDFMKTGLFSKMHAFEPFAVNFEKLLATAKNEPRLIPHQIALGKAPNSVTVPTVGLDSRARLGPSPAESDGELIRIEPLDALGLEATSLIKVDIEGDELDFLEGARETIIRDRPHMALSAYHHADHPSQMLRFLDSLALPYRVQVGHHPLAVYELEYYIQFDR